MNWIATCKNAKSTKIATTIIPCMFMATSFPGSNNNAKPVIQSKVSHNPSNMNSIDESRQATVTVFGSSFVYEGEVDQNNLPCGHGTTIAKAAGRNFTGTWLNGQCHGIGEFNFRAYILFQ